MLVKKQLTLEQKYNDLISELQDIVAQQYHQHGVQLIKKNISSDTIELCFNVGTKELLTMNFNNTVSAKNEWCSLCSGTLGTFCL